MVQVLDPAFVEHDAFLLFDRLMAYAKPWYEFNTTVPAKSLNRRSKSAMDLTAPDNNTQQVSQKKMSEYNSHHQCLFLRAH
jgi:TBC1 domain family protein 5